MTTHSSIRVWRIPIDQDAWWTTAHGVTKTQLSNEADHRTTGIKGKIDSNTVMVVDFNIPLMSVDR